MSAAGIPILLTFLLVFLAWRIVFSFNKDLLRARAWRELTRRSMPFIGITGMAATLPFIRVSSGPTPVVWALTFGVVLIVLRYLSEPADERKATRAFRRGDYEEAAVLYRRLAEEKPMARYYAFLGAALGAADRPDEAIEASGRAAELDPQYGLAYYNRALIQRKQGRKSRAVKDLEMALEADLPRRFRGAARDLLEELKGEKW